VVEGLKTTKMWVALSLKQWARQLNANRGTGRPLPGLFKTKYLRTTEEWKQFFYQVWHYTLSCTQTGECAVLKEMFTFAPEDVEAIALVRTGTAPYTTLGELIGALQENTSETTGQTRRLEMEECLLLGTALAKTWTTFLQYKIATWFSNWKEQWDNQVHSKHWWELQWGGDKKEDLATPTKQERQKIDSFIKKVMEPGKDPYLVPSRQDRANGEPAADFALFLLLLERTKEFDSNDLVFPPWKDLKTHFDEVGWRTGSGW